MSSAIENLLNRAEICAERGQLKVAGKALAEIAKRAQHEQIPVELWKRYMAACSVVDDKALAVANDVDEIEGNTDCGACGTSGVYIFPDGIRTGDCFACVGKGFQTKEDRQRNRWYWAIRQNPEIVNERKEPERKKFVGEWPF